MDMNKKRDVSSDKRLLQKVQDRLVTISVHAKTQNTARTSQAPMEKEGPSLPFLYQG
jgi:hypothetical protein